MEKVYAITENELRDLLYDSIELQMLLNDGVLDNWEWYGESRCEIIKEYFPEASDEELEELSFGDCVDVLLNDYSEVEK